MDQHDDHGGISASDYARKCKELMELNKTLRDLGADTLINLPRIAVIGGQSTGKSSLVEAVSGINVPRDAGTCTRCPMECSMSSSADSWSCVVSLRIDYNDNGQPRTSSERKSFSPVITDKSEVEIWLRRAQAAILSPHHSPDVFVDQNAQQLRAIATSDPQTLKFSRNIVCIDIKDPDATDLSFVDLPGLIQNESQGAIDLVKNLVESYIGSEKTLILIAIPISDDIENQQAVRLAKEADPGGERTIGVLTKPDTLTRGAISSRQKWKDVLQGREHSLKHGYYCVRLPDDDERSRKITHSESEIIAMELFDSTPPWNEISERSRFGIPSLVSNLSKLLIGLIEDSLPKLLQDVNQLLTECQAELAMLPEPVTVDPTTEILTRISKFCDAVRGAVHGEGVKTLAQQNRRDYETWKMKIRGTAPDFRPVENYAQYPRPVYPDPEPAIAPDVAVKVFDLTKVREVIQNSIGWELPFNIPFEAKKNLISEFTSLWQDPTEECFLHVFDNLTRVLSSFVTQHFGRFRQLETFMGSLIQKEVDVCKEAAQKTVLKRLELEKDPLFTQNNRQFTSERSEWLSRLRRWPWPIATDCEYHSPPSSFEEELVVMAEVRAYFEITYRRVIDYMPMTIEHELCQAFANPLQQRLFQIVFAEQNLSAERKKELVGEDPGVAARREQLEEKKKRLMEIRQTLDSPSIRAKILHVAKPRVSRPQPEEDSSSNISRRTSPSIPGTPYNY